MYGLLRGLLIAWLGFVGVVYGQTMPPTNSKVVFKVVDSSSRLPVAGIEARLTCLIDATASSMGTTSVYSVNAGYLDYWGSSDSNGLVELVDVMPSPNCELRVNSSGVSTVTNGQYALRSSSAQLYRESVISVDTSSGTFADLGELTLEPFDRIVTFRANGLGASLMSSLYLNGYGGQDYDSRNISAWSFSNEVQVGFDLSDARTYQFYLFGDGIESQDFSYQPSIGPDYVEFSPVTTDANLTFSLFDSVGNPFYPSATDVGRVYCYPNFSDSTNWVFFEEPISSGKSSLILPVASGAYDCMIDINGYFNQVSNVVVGSGESKEVTFRIGSLGGQTISFYLEDYYGNPVNVPDSTSRLVCEENTTGNIYTEYFQAGNSFVSIVLDQGQYTCLVGLAGRAVEPLNVMVDGYSAAYFVFRLQDSAAEITISLFKLEGSPLYTSSDDFLLECRDRLGQIFRENIALKSNKVTLGVPVGEYSCTLQAPGYRSISRTVDVSTTSVWQENVYLRPLSSKIRFSLVKGGATSREPFIVPDGESANLECLPLQSVSSGNFQSVGVSSSSSSVVVGVDEGSYNCSLFLRGVEVARESVYVPSQQELNVDLEVVEPSVPVMIELLGWNQEAVAVPQGSQVRVNCSQDNGPHYYTEAFYPAKSLSLMVEPGYYTCSLSGTGVAVDFFEFEALSPAGEFISLAPSYGVGASLTVYLYDADSRTLIKLPASAEASLACTAEDGNYYTQKFDIATASATLPLGPGRYSCLGFFRSFSSRIFKIELVEGENRSFDFYVYAPNANLQLDLVNAVDGSSFALPFDTAGGISCQGVGQRESRWFSTALNPQDTSGVVAVREGTYRCEVWIDGYGAQSSVELSVASGGLSKSSVRIQPLAAQVLVRVVNAQTGEKISDREFEIIVNAADQSNHYSYATTTTGEHTFSLIADTVYEVSIGLYGASDDSEYVLPDEIVRVRTTESGVQEVFMQVAVASATVEVDVFGPDGRPLTSGWVEAYSEATQPLGSFARSQKVLGRSFAKTDAFEDHWRGSMVSKGKAKLRLLANRSYTVTVSPDYSLMSDVLPPAAQSVYLADNDERFLTFSLSKTNYTLSVNLDIKAAPTTPVSTFCDVEDRAGRKFFAEGASLSGISIPIFVPEEPLGLKVHCSAFFEGQSEGDDGAFYQGERTLIPVKGTSGRQLELRLANQGAIFAQQSAVFESTQPVRFTLPDQVSSIELPAGAVANDGQATLVAGGAKGYSVSEDNYPLLAFDIKFKSGDKLVSKMNKPVGMSLVIDKAKLAELGATADMISVASFDEDSRTWKKDANFTVREADGVVTVSVSHFSIWGVLVDLTKKLQRPYDLVARKISNSDVSDGDEAKQKAKKKKKGKKAKKKAKKKTKRKKAKKKKKASATRSTVTASNYELCWSSKLGDTTYVVDVVAPTGSIGTEADPAEKKTSGAASANKDKKKKAKKKKKATQKVKEKSKKKNKAKKKKKKAKRNAILRIDSDDVLWETAVRRETKELCVYELFAVAGEHHFRVAVANGEFTEPVTFDVVE